MRTAAIPLALVLVLAAVTPVFGGAGLPRLAEMRAGPYGIALHNDSPTLVAGRNTLTVEMPAAAARGHVRLALVGPRGQTLTVPIRPVTVLGRADEEHGSEADTHSAEAQQHAARTSGGPAPTDGHSAAKSDGHAASPKDDRGGATDDHATPMAGGHGDAEEHGGAATIQMRGPVDVPSTGSWRAILTLTDAEGAEHRAETLLEATDGGPSQLYLAATGSLIVGSLAVGAVARRRPTATPRKR